MLFRSFAPGRALFIGSVALLACSSKTASSPFEDASGGSGSGVGGGSAGALSGGSSGTSSSSAGTGNAGASGAGATAGTGVAGAGTAGSASGTAGSAGASTAGSGGEAGAATGGAGGGGGDVSAGCAPGQLTSTGELHSRYDTLKPTIDGREYFMQVNEWNTKATGTQTMTYGGDFLFKMTEQTSSVATNGGPTGYPSIFIGANNKHTTAGSNLPKQVSALTTVPTSWTWNDNGTLADDTANSYNAAYDVWFSLDPVPANEPNASGPSAAFLMVWYHKPKDAQPIGKVLWPAVTIPGVPGTWDVWLGNNGNQAGGTTPRPCISYVATSDVLTLSFDLNLFIQDAVANRPGSLQSTYHLTNIFSGFEIWRGGVNLESTSWCAAVN